MKEKKLFAIIIMVIVCSVIFADGIFVRSDLYSSRETQSYAQQLGLSASPVQMPENAVALASGNIDYPVTPGDVYTLTYYSSNVLITETISVDSTISVQLPFSGIINASDMTFIELKQKVEDSVLAVYPYAKPQLSIARCGMFPVSVSGQVKYSHDVQVWGLTRLSDLCWYASDYASTREVFVTYADGTVCKYDLYNALLNSDSANNPFVEPGCSVRFVKAKTTVTLSGSTRRTGTFQMLEGETLADLTEKYGEGLLNNAGTNQVTISGFHGGKFSTVTVALGDASSYILADGDNVTVKDATQDMPYIVVEGALSDGTAADVSKPTRIYYQFFPGETAEDLIRNIRGRFIASTNANGIYLTRLSGQKINLHADVVLTTDVEGITPLYKGDVITVPFSTQTVTVGGAVSKPGSYPYVPDRDYSYYINVAGGYTSDAKQSELTIMNSDGFKVSRNNVILADSIINVPHRNTNLASTLTLIATLVTACFNIYDIVK